MAIEIVFFPLNMVDLSSSFFVNVYQGVNPSMDWSKTIPPILIRLSKSETRKPVTYPGVNIRKAVEILWFLLEIDS